MSLIQRSDSLKDIRGGTKLSEGPKPCSVKAAAAGSAREGFREIRRSREDQNGQSGGGKRAAVWANQAGGRETIVFKGSYQDSSEI